MDIDEVRKWFDDHIQRPIITQDFSVDNIELVDNKIVIKQFSQGYFALTEPWPDDWEFGEWIGEYTFHLRAPKFKFNSFPAGAAHINIYSFGCTELELPKCSIMTLEIRGDNLTTLKAEQVKCRKLILSRCSQLDVKSTLPVPRDFADLSVGYAIKMIKAGKKPFDTPSCSINII